MQLDLFTEENMAVLRDKVEKTHVLCDKLRKSFHAKHHGLEKYMTDIKDLVEMQQRQLDRLQRKVYEGNMEPQELRKAS